MIETNDLRAKFAVTEGASVKPGTARSYRDMLRDHLLPVLGNRRMDSINSADAAQIHQRMRKTPRAANGMLSVLSVLHSWARARKLRATFENPTEGIKRYPEKRRTRFLDADETRRFVAAIAQAEAGVAIERMPQYKSRRDAARSKRQQRAGDRKLPGPVPSERVSIDLYSAAALRFLLLTGLRPKEALELKRANVNLATGVAHLPATKTGDRDATLSTHAIAFLRTVPQIESNPYFFCGQKAGRPLTGLQNAFEIVRELAGFDEEVVLYTLRHNFGSTLAAQRVEAYELMRAMGHKNLSTSLRYIHLASEGIQATTSKATAGIAEIMHSQEKSRA